MQYHYEKQQDEYYLIKKEKDKKKRMILSNLGKSFLTFLLGNAFVFLIYTMFISKLVSEKLRGGDDVSSLVCGYSIIAQVVVLAIIALISYSKNEDERRALTHASREEGFVHAAYYLSTWKRFGWMLPTAYLAMQIPFIPYYALLGYYYEAETLFAHFYIPQLFFCELTQSGFFGCILNTVLLALMWGIVMYAIQRIWLRERIRT